MTAEVDAISSSEQGQPFAAPQGVERQAFYLPSGGQSLFAWLHTSATASSIDHGVVICSPIGFEQVHAHRAVRHVADGLARLQMPTLRFDWHGTGDSVGDDHDPKRLETWQENVRSAVRWLKNQFGCRRVSVVGLRMGATIAALSLDAPDVCVENLILWAPVVTGRAYVREMKVIDLTSESQPTVPNDAGSIEAGGFTITRETVDDLSRLSVLQSKPMCQRILLGCPDDVPADQRLVARFADLAIPVDQIVLPGVPEMLAEPHRSRLPETAIQELTSWMRDRFKNDTDSLPLTPLDQIRETLFEQLEISFAVNGKCKFAERAFRINESPDLFGILCNPVTPRTADLPLIVILNAGAAYRVGPGRMNVETARRFAEQGYSSLRLDLCGLGDSVSSSANLENDSYTGTMFRDIQITLQQIQARLGIRRFVLMGLCSGGYAAFQSAVQFRNPALVESILINPLTFFWKDGMTLETAPSVEMIQQHYYLNAALDPGKWVKLLSGKSRIGLLGAVKMLARRLGLNSLLHRVSDTAPTTDRCDEVSHPQIQNLTADLKEVSANGRQLSLFFAKGDPGYGILMRQARRQVRKMLRNRELSFSFVENADHTYSRRPARKELIHRLIEHLGQRYQS